MVRRVDPDPTDHDERLGEAIEAYLALAENGHPPEPEEFASRYPDLGDDLRAALEGLSLVRGLVGDPSGPGSRLESGHRIAGYRIVRELGRGGMGIVYEAVHVGLDRPVALKVLGTHAAPDSTGRRRFLNEARTAAGLHHTHIVPVFDVGQVGGLCYYAMQRIEGTGLDRVLRHMRRDRSTAAGSTAGGSSLKPAPTAGLAAHPLDETASWSSRVGQKPLLGRTDPDDEPPPFEPPRGAAYYRWVARIGRQAAEALAHAHHRGIIHRDVKPSNLLVDARGTVWMADFGLARRLADPSLTQHDSLLGTPRYMSPEQAKVGPIDGRTDVYSLGATLYELLTLRPPFEGRSAAELVEQIRTREPSSPRQFDSRVPRDLETIVLKTLAKRPADRYATAAELADDLGRYLNHEPVRARRIGPFGRLWRVARRHPAITAVSTTAAVIVMTVATVAYVRVVHERDRAVKYNARTQAAMASVIRMSHVPNRRASGLGLIKNAAELSPEPELRAKLRDEAIELLILRDVEPRAGFVTGGARAIAFTADGARLAVLGDNGDRFSLWDVEGRQRLEEHAFRTRAGASELPGGPQGKRVAVEPPGGPQGKRVANRPRGMGGFRGPGGAGLAVASRRVAVILPDGSALRLLDGQTGTPIREVKAADRRRIRDVFAADGGRRLVTVETAMHGVDFDVMTTEYQINLRDADNLDRIDTPLATLEQWRVEPRTVPHPAPLVAVSADGATIGIARSRGQSVSLYSAETGQPQGSSIETQPELTALALGPQGQLAVAGGGAIRLWDLETRASLPSLNSNQGFLRIMRFSPNGTLLAVAGPNHEVELWDASAFNLVAVLPTPDRVSDLAFSPDGRTLAAAGLGEPAVTSVWALIDPVARLQLSGFEGQPTALAFRPDGLMALATSAGSVRFWQPGRCLTASSPHVDAGSDPNASASASADTGRPSENGAIALAFDDRGRLVEVEPRALRCWSPLSTPSDVTRVAFPSSELGGNPRWLFTPLARTSDGRTFVLARGGQFYVWRSSEPDRLRALKTRKDPEPRAGFTGDRNRRFLGWWSLALSPAGDRLYLVDTLGAIHAWSLEGDRVRRQDWVLSAKDLEPALGKVNSATLALSPDGATLAASARSHGIALIDTARGKLRSHLRLPEGESEGQAISLAFAPEARELAVGTNQGLLYLWSLDHPAEPPARLPGHRGRISLLAFGAEGRYLAAGGSDRLLDVWDLERIRTELARLGLAW